jgi:hypothetical protein
MVRLACSLSAAYSSLIFATREVSFASSSWRGVRGAVEGCERGVRGVLLNHSGNQHTTHDR